MRRFSDDPAMTLPMSEQIRKAVLHLHRAKNAAYGNAWKKRGEVMSILANLARKVDRLEHVLDGASATTDESILDTSVDLVVYSLKYQTFLADHDIILAVALFDEAEGNKSYSVGTTGFEVLLSRLDLTPLDHIDGPDTSEAAASVVTAFSALEHCFTDTPPAPELRLKLVQVLTNATVIFLGALRRERSECYQEFLATCPNETL
jgi:hypothetical protein